MAKSNEVEVRLDGPVWDEDGTMYREGVRHVPRALAERLGHGGGAVEAAAEGDDESEDEGEPSAPRKSAAKSAARKGAR